MEKSQKRVPKKFKSERRVLFNSRTFNSKLFLKLTGDFIHPSIVCVQTLRYERENRKLAEIERAIPWLKTFSDFMNFINLKETNESSYKLLIELTWILFYRYCQKNIIFKKPAEKNEYTFILLKGTMLKLDIIFKREYITVEEYLIYLIKMKLIREKKIIKCCRRLNSFYADIDGDNLIKFCQKNPQFNYDKLKEIAKKEIYELGFKLEDFQEGKKGNIINSIDNYIKITDVQRNIKNINNFLATPNFYIGHYQKVGYITKGMLLGNFTRDYSIDNSTYITIDNCDVLYLNKKTSKIKKLYELMVEKKTRILSEIRNSFFLFKNISENAFFNEVIPYFQYKLFHKGDKIFVQDSLFEGIYFIKSGKLNLYLTSSIIEISTYISNIKNSLKNLEDLISNMTSYKSELLSDNEMLQIKSINTGGNIHLFNSKKYDIITINELSIFGTSELYNCKTGLYYFSAECVSDEAVIYFLPKKFFYSLLIKENPVYLHMKDIVQTKANHLLEKLKLIIKRHEMERLYENNNKNFNMFNNYKIINKERNKSLREKFMTKTIGNFYSHTKKTMNKRNLTLGDKLILNKNKTIFHNNIKLKLPSNFPFNVKNEFPTIVKNKNYNVKYFNTTK